MIERWHRLDVSDARSPERISAETCLPPESPWFDGHFPGNPVLPGVAILTMVSEMIRRMEGGEKRRVAISGVRRVRFRRPVRPNEPLSIEVSRESGRSGLYLFRARVGDEIACTGQVLADRGSAGQA